MNSDLNRERLAPRSKTPERDGKSAPKSPGEDGSLATTSVLNNRQMARPLSAVPRGSSQDRSLPDEKTPAEDADEREAPTRLLSVQRSSTALPAEATEKQSSQNDIAESVSSGPRPAPAAPKQIKIQRLTVSMPSSNIEKDELAAMPNHSHSKRPGIVAFEEPPMVDESEKTQFFQRPSSLVFSKAEGNTLPQAAPPTSNSADSAPSRRIELSKEFEDSKRQSESESIAPEAAPTGMNGPNPEYRATMAKTEPAMGKSSLIVRLLLTLNLCTTALLLIVTSLLVRGQGGWHKLVSLFHR